MTALNSSFTPIPFLNEVGIIGIPNKLLSVSRSTESPPMRGSSAEPSSSIVYTHMMPNSDRPAFYIVNVDDGAFVLVSADDIAHRVLGYSLNSTWPVAKDGSVELPEHIRGFFDGDGCITKNQYSITFELNSINEKFLQDIQNIFLTEYNIQTQISTTGMKGRNVPMYRLYCYSNEAKKVFDILYTSNSLFLQRKYNKWIELLKWKNLI